MAELSEVPVTPEKPIGTEENEQALVLKMAALVYDRAVGTAYKSQNRIVEKQRDEVRKFWGAIWKSERGATVPLISFPADQTDTFECCGKIFVFCPNIKALRFKALVDGVLTTVQPYQDSLLPAVCAALLEKECQKSWLKSYEYFPVKSLPYSYERTPNGE